jgi:hypothetical protein
MSRLLSGFFLLAALLLTFASLSGEWLFELCSPVDQFGNRISLFESRRKGEQLTRQVQSTAERTRMKDTVVESLLLGEMTLFEAAGWFRSLHEDPLSWHHPFRPRPAREDGETWCREVIAWAETKVRFEQSPSRADSLRLCLEDVLRERIESRGSVELTE